MNQTQAARLLDLGLDFVARYDGQGNRTAGWQRNLGASGLAAWSSDQTAQQTAWGTGAGGQLARRIAIDEVSGILTILVPLPGGGLVVGALEQWLIDDAATRLADALEAAVKREFGQNWAPIITVGVGAAALFLLLSARRST